MKKIAILGSTGSIGTQTLEIVREQKDICVRALAAGNNIDLLEQQIREFHPVLASVQSEEKAADLRQRLRDMDIKIVSGMDGLIEVATEPQAEILVTAVVGMLGLRPTVEAIKAKKTIALANKETLVTAGHLIMPLAKECGVRDLVFFALMASTVGRSPNIPTTAVTKISACGSVATSISPSMPETILMSISRSLCRKSAAFSSDCTDAKTG